ncbi:MAG: C40 family peptidase [Clostridia bacterium]|nr:C40 family peptidase [Clostridia bacterium]
MKRSNTVKIAGTVLAAIAAAVLILFALSFSSAAEEHQYPAPKIRSAENVSGGVTLRWTGVPGAKRYVVYRRAENSEELTVRKLTSDTVFTDRNFSSGQTFYYSVAIADKITGEEQSLRSAEFPVFVLTAPTVVRAANSPDGVSLIVTVSAGTQRLEIYRRSAEKGLEFVADTRETSYIDVTAEPGITYKYTAVACNDGEGIKSAASKQSVKATYMTSPSAPECQNTADGVNVAWETVPGAQKYILMKKTGAGPWKRAALLSSASYKDADVEPGTEYSYKVACAGGNGARYPGTVFSAPSTITYIPVVSSLVYTVKPLTNLYAQCGDGSPALTVLYMTELEYVGVEKSFASGCWIRVKYEGSDFFIWQASDGSALTAEKSEFIYTGSTEIEQKIIDRSLELYSMPVRYKKSESSGVPAEDGNIYFDCSGFASYVLNQTMRDFVPAYRVFASVAALYSLETVYNKGIAGEFKPFTVAVDQLKPGDMLFFDLRDEASYDNAGIDPATHCGLYLGNNEFIHCTHYNFGPDGLFIMPLTDRYLENLVLIRRFVPEAPTPARLTMYTRPISTNVRAGLTADSEVIDLLPAETPVTVQYVSVSFETGEPLCAYAEYGAGKSGFIFVSNLVDRIDSLGEKRYVAATSVKLYETASATGDYTEVFCTSEVVYNGVYSNSHFHKVNYGGRDLFLYCSDEQDIDELLTADLETLLAGKGERVLTKSSNLRSNMDATSRDSVIRLLRTGEKVTLIAVSRSGSWSYVRCEDGTYGFVSSSALGTARNIRFFRSLAALPRRLF